MAFTEDLTPFYADFGSAATVAGVSVSGIFDKETPDAFGIVPGMKAMLRVPSSVTAVVGDTVVVGGVTYVVAAIHNADFSSAEKLLGLK